MVNVAFLTRADAKANIKQLEQLLVHTHVRREEAAKVRAEGAR